MDDTPAPKQAEPAKKVEATPAVPKKPRRTVAAGNVWAELLGILQKRYPPLYGALFVKKAKFSNDTLYLVNETYVKEIVNMFHEDFTTALTSVCGSEAKVSFVTETEFDSIEEEADTRVQSLVEQAKAAAPQPVQEDTPAPLDSDAPPPEADPLDALLTMGNDDIVMEDE